MARSSSKTEAIYLLEDRNMVEKVAQYYPTQILYELPQNVTLQRDFYGKIIGKINNQS